MKQNIEIEVPDGMKAICKDGKIEFVKVEPVRSKSWEEFREKHPTTNWEWYIDSCANICNVGGRGRHLTYDKNLLATKEDAQAILALIQLTRLYDEWVGDWEPNWWNTCQNKFCIIFVEKRLYALSRHTERHLLSFPTKEMAEEFMKYFKDLLETAKRFI